VSAGVGGLTGLATAEEGKGLRGLALGAGLGALGGHAGKMHGEKLFRAAKAGSSPKSMHGKLDDVWKGTASAEGKMACRWHE